MATTIYLLKNNIKYALYVLGFFIFIFAQIIAANAATRTWDGGGASNNFSEAANWSGDIAPTSADDVVFNNTSVKSAAVDAAFTVNSISINSGYTGTITQNAVLTVNNAFTQSAGTFQGTAANANFGTLILNDGSTFNAPSGTLSVTSQSAYYIFDFNGGTFNANGGTFNADGRPDTNYFRGLTPTFNNLIFSKPVAIIGSPLIVDGDLTLASGSDLQGNYIQANSNVSFADGANTVTGGSTEIRFSDAATRTATVSGTTISLPIIVNNSGITVTTSAASGTVVWNKKVTIRAGKLQQTAANYTFSVGAGFNSPGFSVEGGTFQGGAGNAVFNTSIGISSGNFNGGGGDLGTNAANCPAFPQANYFFQQSGGSFNGGAGSARFCDLRRTGGNFTAPSGNLTILNYGDFAGGTFSANNGTLTIENAASINAPGFTLNNVTLLGANGHGISGAPKPQINGTLNLAEGQFSSGEVAVGGDLIYGANFTGGGGRLFFEGTATRAVNLPARNVLLGMTLDNPNITVTTSGAGASTFTSEVEVRRGLLQQGSAVLNIEQVELKVSGGTFQGSSSNLNAAGIAVSGGAFQGGTGLVNVAGRINTSGGTFSSGGDVNLSTYTQSGGIFNAPNGLMTVVADWTHTAGGTFNPGTTGTVKFTGYNTFNCANNIGIDVATIETFNNLDIANTFCNRRFVGAGDTLIVNGDLRLTAAAIEGGRIRPLGTTTITASNAGYVGSTIVEYVTPNRAFVINHPSSAVRTLPIEMNAANSTLTGAGTGRLNVYALDLLDGTVNQGASVWDLTNAGLIQNFGFYRQSGGTFNGNAFELFVNPTITGGAFNGGTGKINVSGFSGSIRQTGGTFATEGDLDTSIFTLEGGTFNAPLGTMRFVGGNGNCAFSHTAAGGTFNPRTGTVEIAFGGCGFDVNQRETFNNLVLRGGNFIAANDTLVVNGATVFNGGFANGGSIEANGDVRHLNGGSGNTNGNPSNGTTVLKFVDTAARTVDFNTANAGYAVINTLVDNPNIIINLGTNENALAGFYNGLTLRQGTINQGAGQAPMSVYNQTGGTYNGGTYDAATNLNSIGSFTLSGGTFNAAPTTTFAGNFTHTAGGAFNHASGTIYFFSTFNGANGTVDVNQTETFNNVNFRSGNGTNIAAGDTLIIGGTATLQNGTINGGTIDAKGDVNVTGVNFGGNFQGGNANVRFSGAANQTFRNADGRATFGGTWTIDKPNSAALFENGYAPAAPTTLLLSGSVGSAPLSSYPAFNIVSGNVVQTGNFNHALRSLSVAAGTGFVNEFGGGLTLAGNLTNDGNLNFDGGGSGCPQADAIVVRSSVAGSTRQWSGAGRFRLVDVDLKDQTAAQPIIVYSGTDAGNNANFVFNGGCLAPTAATATVGGKIVNASGRGISRVRVILVDAHGDTRFATTNALGKYRFADVGVGQTVTISIVRSKHKFASYSQIINVADETGGVDFQAN